MKKILIIGANGFVGRALCRHALKHGFAVRCAVRSPSNFPYDVETVAIGDINGSTDWTDAFSNCDLVIHLAARVHVMRESSKDPLFEFRKVNVAGTEHLARSAAAAGVKRFLFLSSIGVNGLATNSQQRFSEYHEPSPHNPYAFSKWEAEQALHRVALETGLEVVIIRSPLIYGASAPGNFGQLMRAVAQGLPLPLAAVKNQRDFIYVGNLVDALITCATHPNAAGETYFVSDGVSVSTPDLLRNLANAMGVSSRLFYVPVWMLKFAGKLLRRSAQIERLTSSLQVDISKIRRELDWEPPYTLRQGLEETVLNS